MMMVRMVGGLIMAAAIFGFGTSAEAAYRSKYDINLHLNLAPSLIQPTGSTGALMFNLQEMVHDELTANTGQEVDHFYVWVYVNGQPVAAVDPLCSYDFDRPGGGKSPY